MAIQVPPEPDDVYRDTKGQLWKVVGYCASPVVWLQSESGEKMSFGIGGSLTNYFTKEPPVKSRNDP